MSKNKKRTHRTTKNTQPNVYKVREHAKPIVDVLNNMDIDSVSDEDFAVLQSRVLTQSNEKILEHLIGMISDGYLQPQIEECRSALSKEYPILNGKIMEREMFVVTMYLTSALMKGDTSTINEWSNSFKNNPMEVIVRVIKFIEFIRKDKDLTKSLSKLDKIVNWDS